MSMLAQNGFEIYPTVFKPEECRSLVHALEIEAADGRAGSRNILRNELVASFATDERLTTIATKCLGRKALAYKAIFFDKSEEANWLVPWHQDRLLPMKDKLADPDWGPWTKKDGVNFVHAPTWAMERVVALRVHLDDSTTENGPLRVIAGSHRYGVLDQSDVIGRAKVGTEITCTLGKGGVIAMKPLLIHASSKSTSDAPRRVLHLEYADDLQLAENIELALS